MGGEINAYLTSLINFLLSDHSSQQEPFDQILKPKEACFRETALLMTTAFKVRVNYGSVWWVLLMMRYLQ